jgi:hypothetical protein
MATYRSVHYLSSVQVRDQYCRICGCTEDNACDGGCFWIEDDLCSACVSRGWDKIHFRMNDLQRAYIAGIIDGEGTIYKETKTGRWQVRITQKDVDLLKRVQSIVAMGTIYELADHHHTLKPGALYFRLVIQRQEDVRRLLLEVVPLLSLKHATAACAIRETDRLPHGDSGRKNSSSPKGARGRAPVPRSPGADTTGSK